MLFKINFIFYVLEYIFVYEYIERAKYEMCRKYPNTPDRPQREQVRYPSCDRTLQGLINLDLLVWSLYYVY